MLESTTDPDPTFERRLLDEMPALRAMLGRLGGRADVDDLAQETVARALRYRASYDGGRPVGGWLRRIAFRVYLAHRAAARTRVGSTSADPDRVAAADRLAAERRDRLETALGRLTPVEREVVIRFHARAESIAEIAAAMAIKAGTIKSHLHRARRKMAAGEEER